MVGHRREQSVPVADVVVRRHGIDSHVLAELAHAQSLEAVPIDEVDRRLDDSLPAEPRSLWRS
jgi:hypothetical protein